jgi:endo-1,4-beta-xylanase
MEESKHRPSEVRVETHRATLVVMCRLLLPLSLALFFPLAVLGCGGGDDPKDPDGPGEFLRPVVLSDRPLSLSNPQQDVVTWPVWGGAFTLEEALDVRVSMRSSGAAASGLLFAGPPENPEEPELRRAIQLVADGTGWTLRETMGGDTLQEMTIAGPSSADFVLGFDAGGRALTVASDGDEFSLVPGEALAPDGVAIGVYVHLAPGAGLAIDELALTQRLPVAGALGAPLRELAAARGVEMGTATDVWPPLHDIGFESLLGEQFDTAAPTELYWATTRGEDQDYFFLPADLVVNYASVHGQTVNGYFLVWDFELPQWLTDIAGSGDAEALGEALDDDVRPLVDHYRGRVQAWVVVNEAIWGPDETGGDGATFAESIWSDVLGPEYIERAFQVARDTDPDAILLYNETGAEALGEKSDFLHGMAADFVARQVPIDGIGLQFHIDAAAPPDMAAVQANMERFGALGLHVYITELDVSLATASGTEAEKLELQANIYADVLDVCLSVPACRSYTVFGFSDRYGWDELGDATPLIFDDSYRPKPAYFAIQSTLQP